jgi:Ca2+-binding EF-hand superfamily protein
VLCITRAGCDEGLSGSCTVGSDYNDCRFDGLRRLPLDEVPSGPDVYRYHLALKLTGAQSWLSKAADDETDCRTVTRLEKCSGCTGAKNVSMDGAPARCQPFEVGYPSPAELCHTAMRSGELFRSEWCLHANSRSPESGTPKLRLCACLTRWEVVQPNWNAFFIALLVLGWSSCLVVTAIWALYQPSWAEFGYPGMDSVHDSQTVHPGQFYCPGSWSDRENLAITIMEKKLGRAPSTRLVRKWRYSPALARCLTGASEELCVTEDLVIVRTQGGLMPCMRCVCPSAAMDKNEYYMLLRDANFVEIGAELHPLLHDFALFWLTLAVATLFASFLPGLWSALQKKWNWTQEEVTQFKWALFCGSVMLYLVCEMLAGKFKRGYVLLNVAPGGTVRGVNQNRLAGSTPFFVRLSTGHPDSHEEIYTKAVAIIRSAIHASRIKGTGETRATLRFKAAGRAVRTAVRVTRRFVEAGPSPDEAMVLGIATRFYATNTESFELGAGEASAETNSPRPAGPNSAPDNQTRTFEEEQRSSQRRKRSVRETAKAWKQTLQRAKTSLALSLSGSSGANAPQNDHSTAIKIFHEIDKDGSGLVSFDEFSAFITKYVGDRGHTDVDMARLQQNCRIQFDGVNQDDDGELSVVEFSQFMDGGVASMMKAAGLWNAMGLATEGDVSAIESCFDRYDDSGDGTMDVTELLAAFNDLELYPTVAEVEGLLRVFDADHSGSLDKEEFVQLMMEYIHNTKTKKEYFMKNYCPINLFAMDFDFIPWGQQRTVVSQHDIVTVGHAGIGGCKATSTTSFNSIEMAKTRWLHVEGNPAPMWKINMYLAEALLIYSFLYAHEWFTTDYIHPEVPKHKNELSRSIAITWFVMRVVVFIMRKRAVASTYCWGKPTTNTRQAARCTFPVPIHDIEELCQAFLEIKGIDKKAGTRVDTFRTKLPGYGFIPLPVKSMRGMHSAYFGDRHFKLEKVSGGGGGKSMRRFTRIDFLVGLLDDIKWVHVAKRGKSFKRLFWGAIECAIKGLTLALPIAIGLAQIKCRESLNLDLDRAKDWDEASMQGGVLNNDQTR